MSGVVTTRTWLWLTLEQSFCLSDYFPTQFMTYSYLFQLSGIPLMVGGSLAVCVGASEAPW